VCSWSQDGRSFVIDSKSDTLSSILQLYFNHSRWLSFSRQFNNYGFTLVANTSPKVYCHPNFHRDIKDPYTLEKLLPYLPGKWRRELRQQLELEAKSEHQQLELDSNAMERELGQPILDRKVRQQSELETKSEHQQLELNPNAMEKERRTSPTTVATIGKSGGLSSSNQLELDPNAKEKEQRTSSPTTVASSSEANGEQLELDPKPKGKEQRTSSSTTGIATTGESGRLSSSNDVLSLNIGGVKIVKVLRKTLTCVPESLLAFWFSGRSDNTLPRDKYGNFFINHHPKSFEPILAHLKSILLKGTPLVPSMPSDYGKTWDDAFHRKVEHYGLTKSMYPVEWREHTLSSKNESDSSIAVLHPKYDSNHRTIKSFEMKLGAIGGLHNYVGWVGSSASEEEDSVRPAKRGRGETAESVGREPEEGFVSIFLCFNIFLRKDHRKQELVKTSKSTNIKRQLHRRQLPKCKGDQCDVCLAIRSGSTDEVVVVASWASLEKLFHPFKVPKEIVVRSENHGRAWYINGIRLKLNIEDQQDFDAFMNIHAGDLLPFHRVRGSIELSSFEYEI